MKDATGLKLVARAAAGDVYYLQPRSREAGDPHASYHRDGRRHIRSFDAKIFETQCQPLDANFRGAESVYAEGFMLGALHRLREPCDPDEFDDVIAVDVERLSPRYTQTVSVTLVAPGASPPPDPWRKHKNAKLAPAGRALVVQRLAGGQRRAAVARAFGISERTVTKWYQRWRVEGAGGLVDRSSSVNNVPSNDT